jgi:hypothetical protein
MEPTHRPRVEYLYPTGIIRPPFFLNRSVYGEFPGPKEKELVLRYRWFEQSVTGPNLGLFHFPYPFNQGDQWLEKCIDIIKDDAESTTMTSTSWEAHWNKADIYKQGIPLEERLMLIEKVQLRHAIHYGAITDTGNWFYVELLKRFEIYQNTTRNGKLLLPNPKQLDKLVWEKEAVKIMKADVSTPFPSLFHTPHGINVSPLFLSFKTHCSRLTNFRFSTCFPTPPGPGSGNRLAYWKS